MPKPILLIISTCPLHNGPRMIREINALKDNFSIIAFGSTPPIDNDIKYFNINLIYGFAKIFAKLLMLCTKRYYTGRLYFAEFGLKVSLKLINPAVVINHNPIFLPVLLANKNRKYKVVFNAHEYHPLEFEDNLQWMATKGNQCHQIYHSFLPKLDLLINVSEGIALKCYEIYGKKSLVIPNAAIYNNSVKPIETKEVIKIIHHGLPNPDRKIELMVEAVKTLGPKYSLDLMLVPNTSLYFKELEETCNKTDNVRIISTVPFNQIIPTINQYDIGLYTLPSVSFNNMYALPNKFFEFIQARLCLVVGPSIEMAKIVNENSIGYVTENFTSDAIVKVLKGISRSNIDTCKRNAANCALSLSAETYYDKLKASINNLL